MTLMFLLSGVLCRTVSTLVLPHLSPPVEFLCKEGPGLQEGDVRLEVTKVDLECQ